MSDKETLERFMDDGIWRPKVLEAAIRGLLEENAQQKLISRKLDEALGNAQHELAREMEENERLRAEVDQCDGHGWLRGRIDAALALHQKVDAGMAAELWECSVCIEDWPCPTVKALKGEK